jgi:hypothetical protein
MQDKMTGPGPEPGQPKTMYEYDNEKRADLDNGADKPHVAEETVPMGNDYAEPFNQMELKVWAEAHKRKSPLATGILALMAQYDMVLTAEKRLVVAMRDQEKRNNYHIDRISDLEKKIDGLRGELELRGKMVANGADDLISFKALMKDLHFQLATTMCWAFDGHEFCLGDLQRSVREACRRLNERMYGANSKMGNAQV